jgi:hypothetical protein
MRMKSKFELCQHTLHLRSKNFPNVVAVFYDIIHAAVVYDKYASSMFPTDSEAPGLHPRSQTLTWAEFPAWVRPGRAFRTRSCQCTAQ